MEVMVYPYAHRADAELTKFSAALTEQLGSDAALLAFGLDKVAGAKQLLRAYEATRRMDPRMATPGGLEARTAFNNMARDVGGHRNMPRAISEVSHPEGMTLPRAVGARGLVNSHPEGVRQVRQLFSHKLPDESVSQWASTVRGLPTSQQKEIITNLHEDLKRDPYADAAEAVRRRGQAFSQPRLTPAEESMRVEQRAQKNIEDRQKRREFLNAILGRQSSDPRDIRELISGRHVPKGVDRASAVLVRPEELPHEPYSVQWKGGVPLPRNTPSDTAVWATGYPTIAGGYATQKMHTGASYLRAYPINPATARYTPHLALDVRAVPEERLKQLSQLAGASASGGLPHYERVTSHRELGSPFSVFKPVVDGRYQQVMGAPMPRVGSGIGDM